MAQTVIDDAKIKAILADPNMRREFPFLATAHAKIASGNKSDCGGCGRKNRGNQADLGELRKALATMPIDRKAKLKEMLGGQQVVVKYNNGRGKNIKLMF